MNNKERIKNLRDRLTGAETCIEDTKSALFGYLGTGTIVRAIKKMKAEITQLRNELAITHDAGIGELKSMLNNLLAIIHRDGGHHTTDVGEHKSVQDAINCISKIRENESTNHKWLERGERQGRKELQDKLLKLLGIPDARDRLDEL